MRDRCLAVSRFFLRERFGVPIDDIDTPAV